MLNEKDLIKYEILWMEYLTSIDRAWNKINYLSNSIDRKNIKKIIDDVNHDRNTDELLVYLMQARNVSEHKANSLLEFENTGLIIKGGEGGGIIKSGEFIGSTGQIIDLVDNNNIIIYPKKMIVVSSIISRNIEYKPPIFHKGSLIGSKDPAILAEMGLKYYVNIADSIFKSPDKPS